MLKLSKKALLIYPACLYDNGWIRPNRYYQQQLLVLYSYLKQNGIDVETLELDQEIGHPRSPEDVALFPYRVKNLLRQFSFDIVGISCYTSGCYLSSLIVAQACRELNRDCTIVVGGYHATVEPGDFTSPEGLFDYVVKGEGEEALLEICRGFHSRDSSATKVIEGTPRPLNQGIELNWQDYRYTKRNLSLPVGLSFTRGCPFRCAYCVESTLKFKPREYPVGLALRDIKNAVQMMNPNCLKFDDPLFPLYSDWGQELLSALAQENFPIPIFFMTRIDLFKEEHLKVVTKLDAYTFFGIETCSENMLRILQKTSDTKTYLRKIKENLALVNNRGIFGELNFICNHPGETQETFRETMDFLWGVYSAMERVSTDFNLQEFIYLPGTIVSERLKYFEEEFGTIVKYPTWWKEHGNHMRMSRDLIPSREAPYRINWQPEWDRFLESISEKCDMKSWLLKLWLLSQSQTTKAKQDAYILS